MAQGPTLLLTLGDLARHLDLTPAGAMRYIARHSIAESYVTPQGIRLFTIEQADAIAAGRASAPPATNLPRARVRRPRVAARAVRR